jgi:hypothetical protein
MSEKLAFEVLGSNYDFDIKKPKGPEYYYRCDICRAILPSNPGHPCECACGNVALDPEMFKMGVDDYTKFSVLKVISTGYTGT